MMVKVITKTWQLFESRAFIQVKGIICKEVPQYSYQSVRDYINNGTVLLNSVFIKTSKLSSLYTRIIKGRC